MQLLITMQCDHAIFTSSRRLSRGAAALQIPKNLRAGKVVKFLTKIIRQRTFIITIVHVTFFLSSGLTHGCLDAFLETLLLVKL